jgi:hypothetical protein
MRSWEPRPRAQRTLPVKPWNSTCGITLTASEITLEAKEEAPLIVICRDSRIEVVGVDDFRHNHEVGDQFVLDIGGETEVVALDIINLAVEGGLVVELDRRACPQAPIALPGSIKVDAVRIIFCDLIADVAAAHRRSDFARAARGAAADDILLRRFQLHRSDNEPPRRRLCRGR